MAYYVIGGEPIFLTRELRRKFFAPAFRDWDYGDLMASQISGHKQVRKREALEYATLKSSYKSDPEAFLELWSKFHLAEQEARDEAWNVLCDYCCFSGNGYLCDLRDAVGQVLARFDEESNPFLHPMGKVFALECPVERHPWWNRFLRKSHEGYVQIVIDTDQVQVIAGTLRDFAFVTTWGLIRCGQQIEIVPTCEGAK